MDYLVNKYSHLNEKQFNSLIEILEEVNLNKKSNFGIKSDFKEIIRKK
jgi:hypothetical protein